MSFLNLIKRRLLNQSRNQEETVDSVPTMSRHISHSEQKLSSSNTFKLFKNIKKKWKSSFSLGESFQSGPQNSQITVNKKLSKKFFSLRKLYKNKNGMSKKVSIPRLFKKRINKVSKYWFHFLYVFEKL